MQGKLLNLTGQRFGLLTVLKRIHNKGKDNGHSHWLCSCDCGKEKIVRGGSLKNGTSRSCGCLAEKSKRKHFKDITGQRFGKLVVLNKTDKRISRFVVWECKCDCGNTCEIISASLTNGRTKSCGCLKEKYFK